MATIRVMNPSARSVIPQKPLAVRPTNLTGKRVGLLFNTKPNADVFLTRVGQLISAKHGPAEVEFLNPQRMFYPLPSEFQPIFDKARDCVVGAWGD